MQLKDFQSYIRRRKRENEKLHLNFHRTSSTKPAAPGEGKSLFIRLGPRLENRNFRLEVVEYFRLRRNIDSGGAHRRMSPDRGCRRKGKKAGKEKKQKTAPLSGQAEVKKCFVCAPPPSN